MPINYIIKNQGHFIEAILSDPVTSAEFIEYELAHAIDPRVREPLCELMVIERDACSQITSDDMRTILDCRKEIPRPGTPHRCAIVVTSGDTHAWNLAKFYEDMVRLHSPESVIVFGDLQIARVWLGIDESRLRPAIRRDVFNPPN